jgi:hypothetical protein
MWAHRGANLLLSVHPVRDRTKEVADEKPASALRP